MKENFQEKTKYTMSFAVTETQMNYIQEMAKELKTNHARTLRRILDECIKMKNEKISLSSKK